jgi:hypothetical protein
MTTHPHAKDFTWGEPSRVFDLLRGAWSLSRQISEAASMAGMAIFTPAADDGLAYRECGTLRLANGTSFEAERRYVFRPRRGGFTVFFAETPPRLFHDVLLSAAGEALSGEATHLCAADIYVSRYTFRPDGSFSIRHYVRGPRKSYCSDTLYRRLGPQTTL